MSSSTGSLPVPAVAVHKPGDHPVDRALALLARPFTELLAEKADHVPRHLQRNRCHEQQRRVDPEPEHLVLPALLLERLRILEVRLARRAEEGKLLRRDLLDGCSCQRGDERVALSRAHRASSLAAATD